MSMAQPRQDQHEPKTVRPFSFRDKFGYLFGDLGNDFFFMLVSSYLMVFYTDIFGISAAIGRGTLYGCPIMGRCC